MEILGLFLFVAGFIIGLGAVTVIDILGFLGQKSSYWTETTIRSHKVTKPLIWIGTILAFIGGFIFYLSQNEVLSGIPLIHFILGIILILNGSFLSFYVSPYLLKLEKEGKGRDLLSKSLQIKIGASMIVSFVCWWSSVILLVLYLLK